MFAESNLFCTCVTSHQIDGAGGHVYGGGPSGIPSTGPLAGTRF